jgi:hypothetical protein
MKPCPGVDSKARALRFRMAAHPKKSRTRLEA